MYNIILMFWFMFIFFYLWDIWDHKPPNIPLSILEFLAGNVLFFLLYTLFKSKII